jgi:hypothetical protein
MARPAETDQRGGTFNAKAVETNWIVKQPRRPITARWSARPSGRGNR